MTRPADGSYPNEAEMLGASPLLEWVDRRFLRCDPWAFRDGDFQQFTLDCSSAFGIDPNGVFCTGSGAVGLSLNPGKIDEGSLKIFDDGSDLDIALISDFHFEQAWRDLRERSHPGIAGELEQEFASAMTHQRKRFFEGAILTHHLLPYLSFGPDWRAANTKVSESAAIALGREVEVNYWIYRDYWSVRSYVAKGLRQCQEELA